MLDRATFWKQFESSIGQLRSDGSLLYVLLDKTYRMLPIVRTKKTTFTDFVTADPDARRCSVIVNGNFFDAHLSSRGLAFLFPRDPAETTIYGRIVKDGTIVAGDSRPESFWFGQLNAPTADPWGWRYAAGKGDPPTNALAAVGGIGPLIINDLRYGIGNLYAPGAPLGVTEPPIGEPPDAARPFLIQRNNEMFRAGNSANTGKTILAYCTAKRAILVAVQPGSAQPGLTFDAVATIFVSLGFDNAVFLDGGTSVTLIVGGKIVVAPVQYKNDIIDVGIGFYR